MFYHIIQFASPLRSFCPAQPDTRAQTRASHHIRSIQTCSKIPIPNSHIPSHPSSASSCTTGSRDNSSCFVPPRERANVPQWN